MNSIKKDTREGKIIVDPKGYGRELSGLNTYHVEEKALDNIVANALKR
ncbi:hypothetical protein [Paucisalibacillus sp. EB02]|nr:hypothetical protein [Paucisalibacillus sp. EB02]